ncbi:N-terminal nucleophile aminohydrolase [Gymnopus androsaceus JB14]|uniref:N-terminal nucleophile aminohydrolase n=1 Tax=Gymnopus androsaceus JB14 TaxID=1447944 RepID=A0A6A4ITW0_9AGAR|nr:N-terminal nucleophile aminohydrolase [Gymnopus androsaceus JB14]
MHTFIAVHGGAGSHSSASKELKQALRLACKTALESSSSLDVTEKAISILEDDPNLNAGFGSNLTLEGTVECDAAIMDGQNHFGSVGAVSGVKNPIRIARAILEHSQVPDPLGRIPPLTLVSSGAHAFASKHPHTSSQIVDAETLVNEKAKTRWRYWKDRWSSANSIDVSPPTEYGNLHDLQDTVGAVACCSGNMAAGVSSGGLLLKMEGRCGEAAVFGAGCWAQNICPKAQIGMACSISGTGEYITRSGLARALGKAFEALPNPDDDLEGIVDPHAIMQQVLVDEFWKPSRDLGESSPSAGILLMTYEDGADNQPIVRVWCAFTTPTMAIAYASSQDPNPKALILRRPKEMDHTGGRNDNAPVYMTAFSL